MTALDQETLAVDTPATVPAPEDAFPVGSYAEASKHLRRPFTPEAVKFKVQATWDGGAMVVFYIDARLVVERLNLVCPENWEPRYTREGNLMWCVLSVFGIARPDVGDGYQGKGLVSDALKRAAVQFGVGVSLYAVPKVFLKLADGHLRQRANKQGAEKYQITDAGERVCRERYREWLTAHGIAKFGDVLDHGDVEGAAGDVDAEAAPPERESRLPVAAATPAAPPEVDPRDEIDTLLMIDDPLKPLRAAAVEGMRRIDAKDPQVARELKAANAEGEKGIRALIKRIENTLGVIEEGGEA